MALPSTSSVFFQAGLIFLCCFVEIVSVIEPKVHLTKNLLFLLDCSGSMNGERYIRAIKAALAIAGQQTDEINIAAIAFDHSQIRWSPPERPDEGHPLPSNWAKLPDAEMLTILEEWMLLCDNGGNTAFLPALREAFADPMKELSIIVISDGMFDDDSEEVRLAFETLQEDRFNRFNKGVRSSDYNVTILAYGITTHPMNDELKLLVGSVDDDSNAGYFLEKEDFDIYDQQTKKMLQEPH